MHFKPLRAIAPVTRSELYRSTDEGSCQEFSFKELEEECKYIKRLTEVQTNFVSYLNMESWEEAIKNYSSFTSKEKLEPFFGLTFRPGKMPPSFVKLTFNREQNVLKFTSAAVIAPLLSSAHVWQLLKIFKHYSSLKCAIYVSI